MTGSMLMFLTAVILPFAALWWLSRNSDLRGPAAILGGQVLVTPAMIWIAVHEATPVDWDAWGAVIGVIVFALVVSGVLTFVLEQTAKESAE